MADEQNLQNEGTTNQTGAIDIPDMVPSFKTSVDINVSQELKTKIVNGQYVDLAKLLNNTIEPQKQMIVMVIGELETVEKAQKRSQILSIHYLCIGLSVVPPSQILTIVEIHERFEDGSL